MPRAFRIGTCHYIALAHSSGLVAQLSHLPPPPLFLLLLEGPGTWSVRNSCTLDPHLQSQPAQSPKQQLRKGTQQQKRGEESLGRARQDPELWPALPARPWLKACPSWPHLPVLSVLGLCLSGCLWGQEPKFLSGLIMGAWLLCVYLILANSHLHQRKRVPLLKKASVIL